MPLKRNVRYGKKKIVLHLVRGNMNRRRIEVQFIHFEHMNTITTHLKI